MHPVLLEIGPLKLHMYGLMIAIGFLVALHRIQREAEGIGIDSKSMGEMGFMALFLGVAGTRILHIVMYPESYSWSQPLGWFAVWNGGLVFQGAIPATFLYAYITLKRRGIRFGPVADIVIPYLPLAQAFGRIGCFFNGCCYGVRADEVSWAVSFPKGSPAFHEHAYKYADLSMVSDSCSFPVHPTQLYSALGLALLCGVLLLLRWKWRPFDGFTMPLYCVLYGMLRFVVEMFRGDNNPTGLGLGYLSNQQVFSVLLVLAGAVILVVFWRRGARVSGSGSRVSGPEGTGREREGD